MRKDDFPFNYGLSSDFSKFCFLGKHDFPFNYGLSLDFSFPFNCGLSVAEVFSALIARRKAFLTSLSRFRVVKWWTPLVIWNWFSGYMPRIRNKYYFWDSDNNLDTPMTASLIIFTFLLPTRNLVGVYFCSNYNFNIFRTTSYLILCQKIHN